MIGILGYYSTQFGELWDRSLFDLVQESINGVLSSSGIEKKQIDAVFFSNMMSGILENNLHGSSKISQLLKTNIPIFRCEAACASGGIAVHLATQYLKANSGKTVLVVGAEKMTDFSPEETVGGLMAAASGEEQEAGLTFPGLYALLAQVYLAKFSYSRTHLAAVTVKNHFHGSLNQKAHFKNTITIEQVLQSPQVAFPFGVLDCSPISDGSSALILSSNRDVLKKASNTCSIIASEVATDSISLAGRSALDELSATVIASEKSFKVAKMKRTDIQVAEVHDCFTIAEILAMEDLGFWKKGDGGKRVIQYETMIGKSSSLVVNTSGGLKASGHPVGATGIKQVGEIYLQLTGQAQGRQLKRVKHGLAHNVGGSGGTAVVTILGI